MLILASFGTAVITIGMVSVSILMIGLILLQKNRGSGLSGAFGGVGGHSAFGTKTGDFLTWVTVGLTAVFLLLAIVGNYVFEPSKLAVNVSVPTTPAGGPTPESGAPVAPAPGQPAGAPQGKAPPIQLQTTPMPTTQPS